MEFCEVCSHKSKSSKHQGVLVGKMTDDTPFCTRRGPREIPRRDELTQPFCLCLTAPSQPMQGARGRRGQEDRGPPTRRCIARRAFTAAAVSFSEKSSLPRSKAPMLAVGLTAAQKRRGSTLHELGAQCTRASALQTASVVHLQPRLELGAILKSTRRARQCW